MSIYDEYLKNNHDNPVFATAMLAASFAAPARHARDRQPYSPANALLAAREAAAAAGQVFSAAEWPAVEIAFKIAHGSTR